MEELQLEAIVNMVAPIVTSVLGAVIVAIVGLAASKLNAWLHIKISAQQQQMIVTAANNAAGTIIAAGEAKIADEKIPVGDSRILQAANVVISQLPGIMKALNLTPEHVQALVAGELGKLQLQSTSPTVAVDASTATVAAPVAK